MRGPPPRRASSVVGAVRAVPRHATSRAWPCLQQAAGGCLATGLGSLRRRAGPGWGSRRGGGGFALPGRGSPHPPAAGLGPGR